MKKLFAVLIVVAILVLGVGFYRGWFALSSPDSDKGSNKVNVNLTMDRDKMNADAEIVKEKAAELTGRVTEEANKPGDPAKDGK
jgi:hypothetical protein